MHCIRIRVLGILQRSARFVPTLATALAMALALQGCATPYYWQAAMGQWQVHRQSESLDALLERDALDPALRERLELTRRILDFARQELLLDSNGSYERYADIGRPYVVWNVFAAPEFSLEPTDWCFPVAGCVTYRGYFREDAARAYADKFAGEGFDTAVLGVRAYSTLGKLRDPVMNTMLGLSEPGYVGLLFHELAHHRLYVKGDTAFNESFATAVEQIGLERWRAEAPMTMLEVAAPAEFRRVAADARRLVDEVHDALREVYASDRSDARKRAEKEQLLATLAEEYATLSDAAGRPLRYTRLFEGPINNAVLAAIASYENLVPGFRALFNECAGRLACFYASAAELAELDIAERHARLRAAARPAPDAQAGGMRAGDAQLAASGSSAARSAGRE